MSGHRQGNAAGATALGHWLERISQGELPMFAHTARCIASISSYDDSSVAELAQVILRDSAMTARVLRMANSSFYNPGGRRIDTVSYAIALLGFDTVRSLALSIALIDTVLGGVQHDQAMQELARCVHAGIQCQAFARLAGINHHENLFIGAVLHRLGAICFWCFPDGKEQTLLDAYERLSSRSLAERKVLGFSLEELTLALVGEWHLSSLLTEALTWPESNASRLMAACLQLADNVMEGWQSKIVVQSLEVIATVLGLPLKSVTEQAWEHSRLALKTLDEFGIAAHSVILLPDGEIDYRSAGIVTSTVDQQLAIARELTTMLASQVPLNTLLASAVEGIYRALGMDVVVLALIDSQGRQLQAKHAIGHKRELLLNRFCFALHPSDDNLFAHIVHEGTAMHWQPKAYPRLHGLLSEVVLACTSGQEFFAAPLKINQQVRGLLYADRHVRRHRLSDSDFLSFQHFADLANIGMNLLSRK